MRLLLDTHSFLWFIDDSPRLSANARLLLEDPGNDLFLSIASVWELAIKVSINKLTLGGPIETFIPQQLSQNDIDLLGITLSHTSVIASLPLHHRDPFDRMLVAQAQVEHLSVVSIDTAFDAYGIARLW